MKRFSMLKHTACWTFLFTLLFASPQEAISQCIQNSLASPGNISPGNNCIATINENGIVNPAAAAANDYHLFAIDLLGDVLASGVSTINIPLEDHLEQIIIITAIDMATGAPCNTFWLIEDKQPPAITCPADISVGCTSPLLPALTGTATATDNCDDAVAITFTDVQDGPDCAQYPHPLISQVIRTWIATDNEDSVRTCNQTINILRSDTTHVVFPDTAYVDCSQTEANPSVTGVPTINGFQLVTGGLCNIHTALQDFEYLHCGGNPFLLRVWTVWNDCTGLVAQDTQLIKFMDITPPEMTCEDTLTFGTDPHLCNADVTLPLPDAEDDCSPFTVSVEITGIGTGFSVANVPKGTHDVVYTALDECGNFSNCVTTLIVADDETPTAVCDGYKIVTLSSGGTAWLNAVAFNEGSHDNCVPVTFLVSRPGVPFADKVHFDCADLGQNVMVTLRVLEFGNPTSYSDCMTTVEIQDKLPPILATCPFNQTIDCETNYSDLTIFGAPTYYENCSDFAVNYSPTVNVSGCGTGTIVRTWTATDPSGNVSVPCIQTITVVNQTPYNGSTISWPLDYMVSGGCHTPGEFVPANLPSTPVNHSQPVVSGAACAMIATNRSDQVFYFGFPTCFKIVRTWTVIDWCNYNSATNTGIWQHQQEIAVMETQPPTITYCPPAAAVGLNNDCTFGAVSILPVTALAGACPGETMTITNNSLYANSNGANAAGNYPAGVHTVTFTAKDACGNESTCVTTVTVSDLKKPTPYCNNGIVAEIQDMGAMGIMTVVTAEQLNFASSDNCTDTSDLVFNIRRAGDSAPPTATSLVFDCTDLGENLVEIWVTDEAGNSDFCLVPVFVQNNMLVCDDILFVPAMIGGGIENETGNNISGVEVTIAAEQMSATTGNDGNFEFHDLDGGGNYTVTPSKDDNPLNGVSTFDLVLMSRHVLGIAPIASPYKMIAADVNHNGAVSTADIVELRKLVLQIYTDFPNNTSWRFVEKNYGFPDPSNPFSPPFPEAFSVSDLEEDVFNADFVGVKIGDLNCNATTNFSGENTGERSGMSLQMEDLDLREGETFTLPVRASEIEDLLALQFTIEFETDNLELKGIERGALPGNPEEYFGTTHTHDGILTAAWFRMNPVQLNPEDALFSLIFQAKTAGKLSRSLALSSRYTEALAHDGNENARSIQLEFLNQHAMDASATFQLYQNHPNPFRKATTIGFSLPEAGQASLKIYDLSALMPNWSNKAGPTPSARCIRTSRCTRSGITCVTAGRATRAYASIICCSAHSLPRG